MCVLYIADWNAVPVDYNNHYQPTAAQYANSGPYTTGNTSAYIGEYGGAVNERPESPTDDKQAQHSMLPSNVAYLQAPYHDELSEFRITPSPGGAMLDHRFADDPANMVYGYVSPYGTTNSTGKFSAFCASSVAMLDFLASANLIGNVI